MGGFKESLNDLEIYQIQSRLSQNNQITNVGEASSKSSLYERRYLAKRLLEQKESNSESKLIDKILEPDNETDGISLANKSSLEHLAAHFNSKVKKNKK